MPCAPTLQTAASNISAERQPEPDLTPVRTCQQEVLIGLPAQKGAQAGVAMSDVGTAAQVLLEGTEKLRPCSALGLGLNEQR